MYSQWFGSTGLFKGSVLQQVKFDLITNQQIKPNGLDTGQINYTVTVDLACVLSFILSFFFFFHSVSLSLSLCLSFSFFSFFLSPYFLSFSLSVSLSVCLSLSPWQYRFCLLLSVWSLIICPVPFNCKSNVLSASLNITFPFPSCSHVLPPPPPPPLFLIGDINLLHTHNRKVLQSFVTLMGS